MEYYFREQNSLTHWGIKGQRWGLRRFRNEDGTLTEAGRKRYGANLDPSDTSYGNVSKIRRGEIQREYDELVEKQPNAKLKQYNLKNKLKDAENIERGAKLKEKGETVGKNYIKGSVAVGAAYLARMGLTSFLNKRLYSLYDEGKWTPKHKEVAQTINDIGKLAIGAAGLAAGIHYSRKMASIGQYEKATKNGKMPIEKYGGKEYQNALERYKNDPQYHKDQVVKKETEKAKKKVNKKKLAAIAGGAAALGAAALIANSSIRNSKSYLHNHYYDNFDKPIDVDFRDVTDNNPYPLVRR